MSLLIEHMDMPPKGTYKAELYVDENGARLLVDFPEPLVGFAQHLIREIPAHHGRLIDADRLIAVLKSTTAISQSDYDLFNHIVGLIEHQPTVIEAEE